MFNNSVTWLIWLTWCHLLAEWSILLTMTWHDWYTDERVVTLFAKHATILLPGSRRPQPINFYVCVLHLNIIPTKSSLQNLLGIQSSSITLLCNKGALSVCIMVITIAGVNRAAAKAVLTSREKEKRRKSAARTREWCKCQSEEWRSEIRHSVLMGHAERRACLPEDRHSETWQTNLMGYAEGRACLSEER